MSKMFYKEIKNALSHATFKCFAANIEVNTFSTNVAEATENEVFEVDNIETKLLLKALISTPDFSLDCFVCARTIASTEIVADIDAYLTENPYHEEGVGFDYIDYYKFSLDQDAESYFANITFKNKKVFLDYKKEFEEVLEVPGILEEPDFCGTNESLSFKIEGASDIQNLVCSGLNEILNTDAAASIALKRELVRLSEKRVSKLRSSLNNLNLVA